jgi:hypothetical protein
MDANVSTLGYLELPFSTDGVSCKHFREDVCVSGVHLYARYVAVNGIFSA